jgi:hypothetical protein
MSRRVYLSHLDMPKGDFRYWPEADVAAASLDVRFWGDSVAKVVLQEMQNF